MGDFPTLVLARVLAVAVFLGFFPSSPELVTGAEDALASGSIPSGELVVVVETPLSNNIIGSA